MVRRNMTQGIVELEERCAKCGHAFKYSVKPDGTPQPCDVEIGLGMEEISDIPVFCGCTELQRLVKQKVN
jgi:hypothetical protein